MKPRPFYFLAIGLVFMVTGEHLDTDRSVEWYVLGAAFVVLWRIDLAVRQVTRELDERGRP